MDYVDWMKDLEGRFRTTSGLKNRAQYKIFYSPVRPAKILVLGINPGGDPDDMFPDGMHIRSNPGGRGAASTSYYENNEHDILDCNWTENIIRELLADILGNANAIRDEVVKTNLSFRRSQGMDDFKRIHGFSLKRGYAEAAPFIREILEIVSPRLVLLEGSILEDFKKVAGGTKFHCVDRSIQTMHRGRPTDLYRAERHDIPKIGDVIVVKLAHPSYHGEKYEKHKIGARVRNLI